MQALVVEDAPRFAVLRDLSIHLGSAVSLPETPDAVDLSCICCLTNLRSLSLQGVLMVCSAPRRLSLPPALTALLLHGSDDVTAAAAGFGPSLLRLSELQCLDVEAIICRPHGSPASSAGMQKLKRAFWKGVRAALQELPLRLGARVTLRSTRHAHASPTRSSEPSRAHVSPPRTPARRRSREPARKTPRTSTRKSSRLAGLPA